MKILDAEYHGYDYEGNKTIYTFNDTKQNIIEIEKANVRSSSLIDMLENDINEGKYFTLQINTLKKPDGGVINMLMEAIEVKHDIYEFNDEE